MQRQIRRWVAGFPFVKVVVGLTVSLGIVAGLYHWFGPAERLEPVAREGGKGAPPMAIWRP